jgi:tRNA pseudouridine55 synthase
LRRRRATDNWCGVLNLNKPTGVTSRRVVDLVGAALAGTKLGHAGTLDPLATGVLVVCAGAATRLVDYVQRMPKTYRAVIRLGARSDTLDADGRIVEVEDPRPPDRRAIEVALVRQVGLIAQRPPAVSALKIGGRRAYELARAGQAVEPEARLVAIHRIDVLDYRWPRLELEIDCGGGTYIRSVARDLGDELGCGGYVAALTRTRIGCFTLDRAIDPGDLSAATVAEHLQPALEAVAELPRLVLTPAELGAVVQGRRVAPEALQGTVLDAGEVALIAPDGTLAAIAKHDPATGRLQPRRVLATS